MKRICLHGPESTGKSTLGTRLAAYLGCEVVPEYGRAYCEAHGTDIGMAELVHIAQTQDAMNRAAAARAAELGVEYVLFDTDPLITAVWAEMMFGKREPWFGAFTGYADLYLLLDIDLPFIDDGLRVYASAEQRKRFFDLCKTELDNRGVNYTLIQGEGEARFDAALGGDQMTEIADIQSPCIDVCDVDSSGQYCIGCGRSMDEIARWMTISDEQRQTIIECLPERLLQLKR